MGKNRLGRYIFLVLSAGVAAHGNPAVADVQLGTVVSVGFPIAPGGGPGGGGSFGGLQGTGNDIFYVDNPGNNDAVRDASIGDRPCEDGSNPAHANPIVLSTGNKVEQDADFVSSGEMPLSLVRTYNRYAGGVNLFGLNEVSSFDHSLVDNVQNEQLFLVHACCLPRP